VLRNPKNLIKNRWLEPSQETDGWNHHMKDEREGRRQAQRHAAYKNQRRERASPFHGRKLSHPQPL